MSACEVCASSSIEPMFAKLEHQFVRCGDCGLEKILPQPTNETLAQIYGAHYYESWGLHDNVQTVADLKRATFQYVLNKLPTPTGRPRLLDCGAAPGFLLEVAGKLGYEPFGLELSEFGANEIGEKFG